MGGVGGDKKQQTVKEELELPYAIIIIIIITTTTTSTIIVIIIR